MPEFYRRTRLPPYVFSITTALTMAARRRGEDIIDFGIGNPDGPIRPRSRGMSPSPFRRVRPLRAGTC